MGEITNTTTALSPKVKAALAAARLLKKKKLNATAKAEGKSATTKKSTAKKSTKKTNGASRSKRDINWGKIVQMWDAGKSSSEISDALGFTDKKSNWPYSYTLGLIKRLKAGVEHNGKKYKVSARRK